MTCSWVTPSRLVLAFWVGVFTLVWAHITVLTYPGFWLVDEEMAIHSLGHGAYNDNWLAAGKGHANSFFQYLHPGLPLQAFSWIAYRLTAPDIFGSAEAVFLAHLVNPEPFHLATQVLGGAITLLGLFLIWRHFRSEGAVAAFAGLSLPFTSTGNWAVGFWRLDSETFALVLGVGLIASLRLAFAATARGLWLWPGWFWLGVLLGCSYLNKISHIPWFAGAGAGWLAWLWLRKADWRTCLGSGLSALLGLGLAAIGGLLFMGTRQFYQMLTLHARVATHSGTIGEGKPGLVSQAGNALGVLADPAVALAILVLVLIGTGLWQGRRHHAWRQTHLPMGVALLVALLIGLLVVFRQQSNHYFSPTAALLPWAALWLFQAWDRQRSRALALCSLTAIAPIGETWARAESRLTLARERQTEIAEILAQPLAPGEIRLWTFKVQTPQYLRRLAVDQSGVRRLSKVVDSLQPHDFDFNIWRGQVRVDGAWYSVGDLPWRRAVFERRYFKTPAALPEPFRDPSLAVVEGKRMIWVERKALSTQGSGSSR